MDIPITYPDFLMPLCNSFSLPLHSLSIPPQASTDLLYVAVDQFAISRILCE